MYLRYLRNKDGSTLIWALIVVVIITLVLAAGFSIVQRQQNSAVSQHIDNQAYFSAMSVTQAMIEWLTGANSADPYSEQMNLINWIIDNQDNPAKNSDGFFSVPVNSDAFVNTLGTIDIKAKYDAGSKTIYIKTVADFRGQSASVTGTLTGGEGVSQLPKPPPMPDPHFKEPPPVVNPPKDGYIVSQSTNTTIRNNLNQIPNIPKEGFNELWIVDGVSATIGAGSGFPVKMIYITAGSSLTITSNGELPGSGISIFVYASEAGQAQAKFDSSPHGKIMDVEHVYIQPPLYEGGKCGIVDLTKVFKANAKTLPQVHLPYGYYNGSNIGPLTKDNIYLPATITALNNIGIYVNDFSGSNKDKNYKANVCNRPGITKGEFTDIPAPFCTHVKYNGDEPEVVLCVHGNNPDTCLICNPPVCELHGVPYDLCPLCNPPICEHGNVEYECTVCHPPSVIWEPGSGGFSRG